eukprot:scaffold24680_cov221-Isochrysis_galbana.AAC.8
MKVIIFGRPWDVDRRLRQCACTSVLPPVCGVGRHAAVVGSCRQVKVFACVRRGVGRLARVVGCGSGVVSDGPCMYPVRALGPPVTSDAPSQRALST